MSTEPVNWTFYFFLVLTICCWGVGYVTAERGWYAVAVFMAMGAVIAAIVLATADPPGAGATA